MADQSEPARKGAHTPERWQYGVEGREEPIEIWSGDGVRSARFICEVPQGKDGRGRVYARRIVEAPAMEEDVLRKMVETAEPTNLGMTYEIDAGIFEAAQAILARIDGGDPAP